MYIDARVYFIAGAAPCLLSSSSWRCSLSSLHLLLALLPVFFPPPPGAAPCREVKQYNGKTIQRSGCFMSCATRRPACLNVYRFGRRLHHFHARGCLGHLALRRKWASCCRQARASTNSPIARRREEEGGGGMQSDPRSYETRPTRCRMEPARVSSPRIRYRTKQRMTLG